MTTPVVERVCVWTLLLVAGLALLAATCAALGGLWGAP